MFTHYVDIILTEPELEHKVYTRLLHVVHIETSEDSPIAVSFPDWKNTAGEFGYVFRLFGCADRLEQYLTIIQPLVDACLVRPVGIRQAPESKSRVYYSRKRSGIYSASRNRRNKARSLKRGEVARVPMDIEHPKNSHYLLIKSTSTQREFGLHIERSAHPTNNQGGRRYGLGFELPDF